MTSPEPVKLSPPFLVSDQAAEDERIRRDAYLVARPALCTALLAGLDAAINRAGEGA